MPRHVNRIKKLYAERFTLEEIAIAYKIIPYNQLRAIVRGVKRQEKV